MVLFTDLIHALEQLFPAAPQEISPPNRVIGFGQLQVEDPSGGPILVQWNHLAGSIGVCSAVMLT